MNSTRQLSGPDCESRGVRRSSVSTLPPRAPSPRADLGPSCPSEMYDRALHQQAGGLSPDLSARGSTWSAVLPLTRWCGAADAAETDALRRLQAVLPSGAAVLDLGCGPGRHAAHLGRCGLRVLGVDASAAAVALAGARGVHALHADVLGRLPDGLPDGPLGWSGALLLDGNIGIGGDPLLLLCRVRDLLLPDGFVLLEPDVDGVTERGSVHLHAGPRVSRPFLWGRLAQADLPAEADAAGFSVHDAWSAAGRRFALLGPVQL